LLVWTMFSVLSTLTTSTLAIVVGQGGSRRYFTEFGQLPALELKHSSAPRPRILQHTTLSSSSNQTDFTLPYGKSDCAKLPVTYTNDPKQVYAWFSENLETTGCTIGFDVEVGDWMRMLKKP
jgi:hypothetical protein